MIPGEQDTIFLVGFFKFDEKGEEYGFKRIDLHCIHKTLEEAKNNLCFDDEAGWYEGVLIEERAFGFQGPFRGQRVWFMHREDLREVPEPKWCKNVMNLIG